jgi:plastocyanin
MKIKIIFFTIAIILVLVSGCTQPSPTQPVGTAVPTSAPTAPQETIATPPPSVTTESVSPTLPNLVSDNTIRVNKKGFDPASITVKSGSTVRWVNDDSTADAALYNPTHRIALGTIKNSPLLSPGQGWSWIFDQPGSYDYDDMIHTSLHGTVIVV